MAHGTPPPTSAPTQDAHDRNRDHTPPRAAAPRIFENTTIEPALDLLPGRVIGGRYRLLSPLAAGGMGVVYRAERLGLGRVVAIKFLRATYAEKPRYISAFEREAEAMSRLSHPHCVPVIDFGVDGEPYLVMELVAGSTLAQRLELGPLPWERAARIQMQLLAGLAHAHGRQIVHRDIKPANIMLTEATGVIDHVRVLDFGLARLREGAATVASSSMDFITGTPQYMAPEQWRAEPLDSRTDLYAAGVVLCEMLTGRPPFSDTDLEALMTAHLNRPPPPLHTLNPGQPVPPGLERLVMRALAKNPDDRFPSAQAFHDALSQQLEAGSAPTMPVPSVVNAATRSLPKSAQEPLVQACRPTVRSRLANIRPLMLCVLACAAVTAGYWVTPFRGAPTPLVSALIIATAEPPTDSASSPIQKRAGAADRREVDSAAARKLSLTEQVAAPSPSVPAAPALEAKGEEGPTLEQLRHMRREQPRNARWAYLIGTVYFEKAWWSDAYLQYREAMRLDESYRNRRDIIERLIRGLGDDATRRNASAILTREVGAFALPHLRRAAKHDQRATVRARAESLHEHIRCDARRAGKGDKCRSDTSY